LYRKNKLGLFSSWSTWVSLLITVCLLSACGYQLRGQAVNLSNAAGKKIWIESQLERAQLAASLRKRLLQNKINVIDDVDKQTDASQIIALDKSTVTARASAYDAEGDALEYELRYRLLFKVDEDDYEYSSVERYRYNKNELLSSDRNKAEALKQLDENAVSFILRKL